MEHHWEERRRALDRWVARRVLRKWSLAVWTAQECRCSIAYGSPIANLRTTSAGGPLCGHREGPHWAALRVMYFGSAGPESSAFGSTYRVPSAVTLSFWSSSVAQ